MIGVTRRIKCIVVHNPGVNTHPLPAQKFLTVDIPTPKPYIFMNGVTRMNYNAFNSPSHPDHKYIRSGGRDVDH
jgi:hypothetical protein